MANFKVLEEADVVYSLTTWQGSVEFEGETLRYRFSEDENGQEAFVFVEGEGWTNEHAFVPVLWATVSEWGSPVEFGQPGEECDIDDDLLEDWM